MEMPEVPLCMEDEIDRAWPLPPDLARLKVI